MTPAHVSLRTTCGSEGAYRANHSHDTYCKNAHCSFERGPTKIMEYKTAPASPQLHFDLSNFMRFSFSSHSLKSTRVAISLSKSCDASRLQTRAWSFTSPSRLIYTTFSLRQRVVPIPHHNPSYMPTSTEQKPQANTDAMVSENQPVTEPERRDDETYDDSDSQSAQETFDPTIDAIQSIWTTENIASCPQSNDWEPFRAYWHGLFTKLIAKDPGCCPCVLPECEPNITVTNRNGGVTKGEVVKAVRDYFYGKHLKEGPKVWKAVKDIEDAKTEHGDVLREVSSWESEEEGMRRIKKPVVWHVDWMSQGGQNMWGTSYGKVWFYACEAEDFEKEMKQAEEKDRRRYGDVESEDVEDRDGKVEEI
ncbi:hypothetical protein QBC38DRAFT_550256 [Podospora fimiseda]|uniref:Uncharacterized protein n=1 Tax=Podospora fimiseda TaxID=252190 RepID=A0AAN6YN51_9PEZI|nr:hypothetical protein QBC38DRAFT_550256 [Podospora fimiseda]